MLSDATTLEANTRKVMKASLPGIILVVPDVYKAAFMTQDLQEDWGSKEDDVILTSEDERTESEKETTKSGKNDDDMSSDLDESDNKEAKPVDDETQRDEYTEEAKGDEEQVDNTLARGDQAKDASTQANQASAPISVTQKEKPGLPPTSSSLSVSSEFGNQFLAHSFDISLTGTFKDNTNTEINSMLDIQIQHEVPNVQSSSLLSVPVIVIPEPTVLTPIPENVTKALATTIPPLTPIPMSITSMIKQSTPIPTPTTTTKAQTFTTAFPGDEALFVVLLREPRKSVTEIRKIKMEHATKQQLLKHSTKTFDQAARAEFDQKEIIFQMIKENKSYEKHPTHQALYDALVQSLILDEDDMEKAKTIKPLTQKKRRHDDKDQDPSAGPD
ncbi:hypothetical protein Tco_0019702 [Tanacetum coccineum]